jgi:hypothetical protein
MRLVLSSVLLGLVWFVAVNTVATLAAWTLGHVIIRRAGPIGASRLLPDGASRLLIVRLLPAAVSSFFVLAVFLPAHWRFEPVDSDESFGVVLGTVAALGLWLVLGAAWRALRAGLEGYRFATLVRRAARREADAFVLSGLSGVSLAGIWRPRILIGSEARAALTPSELDLAISHEIAHRRSKDNLKRFLMFASPDLFRWTRVARQLEDRWQAEAECEADAHAVRGDAHRAVVLAAALVKVARLGGVAAVPLITPAWTSSAFHVPTLLEMRVRRLVSGSAPRPADTRGWSGTAISAGIAAGVWLVGFSDALHLITETLVIRLP